MKKLLTTLLCAACAAHLFGATQEFKGGTGTSSRSEVSCADPANDALLKSDTGTYYKTPTTSSTETFKSLRAVTGEPGSYSNAEANFSTGTLIIDPNSSAANIAAFTTSRFTYNYMTLTFKNSAATADSSVDIVFGTFSYAGGTSSQKQYLNFYDDTYNVSTTATTTIGNSSSSETSTTGFYIDSTAKVNWGGARITFNNSAVATINGELYTDNKTPITLASGATMNVASGGKLSLGSALTMESGSTLTLASGSTYSMQVGASSTLNGTINTAVAMSFAKISSTAGTFNQTAGGVTFQRPVTFNSGADWTIYEKITLNGGSGAEKTAVVTVNEGANITVSHETRPRVIFSGNNELILNKANAFADGSGNPVALVTVYSSTSNIMRVNADQDFKYIYVNGNTNPVGSGYGDLSIFLDDSSILRFTSTSTSDPAFNSTNANLKIFNFDEDRVYFTYTDDNAARVNTYVKLYADETEESFLGMGILGTDGWLTLTPVPEPATWAAILGFAALGFAAWRRRK